MSETDPDDLDLTDAFRLPEEGDDDPRPIMARLVADYPEFEDLRVGEAVIMVVFRTGELVKKERRILGQLALPAFRGELGAFAAWLLVKATGGTMPDFLMILDAEFWRDATATQREALVFHELMHARHGRDREGELRFTEEGRPVWSILGHDLEEFGAVVRRYGAWLPDIRSFAEALRDGGVNV